MIRVPKASVLPSIVLSLCGVVACAPEPLIGEDVMPLDGAMHLQGTGQAQAFGRNDDAAVKPGNESHAGHAPDPYAGLEAALRERWVHREVHEEEGVDVATTVDLLRQEAEAARGRGERRSAVRRATCRLGDGQLQMDEAGGSLHSDSGLRVRAVGPAFLLEGTDGRYGKALAAGDRIVEVDGAEVVPWADTTCAGPGSTAAHRRARLAESLERGRAGRSASRLRPETITVRQAKTGKVRSVTLSWKPEDDATCVSGEAITGDVGVITVRALNCEPAAFDAQLTSAVRSAGSGHLLLDLRRVVGDDERNAQVLARRFTPAATVWASKRRGTQGGFSSVALPEAEPAVSASQRWLLVSPRCDASCELAAAVIASDNLVTTVGTPTAGSAAETEPVAIGKGITVQVPVVQYALPGSSTLLEGRGITPDVAVTATIDVLGRGHDPEVIAVARRIRGEG
ncbi:MAG: S41 family peptidase [Nannocystales bacterium]